MNVFLRMCFQFAFNVQNTGPEKCGVKELTFKVVIGTVFIVTPDLSFAYTMVLSVLFFYGLTDIQNLMQKFRQSSSCCFQETRHFFSENLKTLMSSNYSS